MQRFNEKEKAWGWRAEEKDGARWEIEEERSEELKVELESYERGRTRFPVLDSCKERERDSVKQD